jgi:aminoglycoside phosphotransferase (APT) family kinase protein
MASGIHLDLPDPQQLERAFERDLAWLSGELRAEVVSAESVSPLRGLGHPRTAFCVDLSDGRRVKLRRMSEVGEAAELERLLAALAPIGFPQVIARRARCLVLEWIPGKLLSDERETTEWIDAAGALLGRMHRTRLEGDALPAERPATAELDRCDSQLAALVTAKQLTRPQADAVADAIVRNTAERPIHGIVHGDFAPENLVIDTSGALHAIDEEVVRIGILDLDLARTWSRWPMAGHTWVAFLAAYAAASGRSCNDDQLFGWKLRTLVVSAWYRAAFRLRGADAAVARLLDFAGALA